MAPRIYSMKASDIYSALLNKALRKKRTKEEVDAIITWLTGYSQQSLQEQLDKDIDYQTFFEQAPSLNPDRELIKGTICGVKIESIEDPLMKNIRILDKMIDELARGKALEKILRQKN